MNPIAIEVKYHLLETSRILGSTNEANFHIFHAILDGKIEILKECRLDNRTEFAVSLFTYFIEMMLCSIFNLFFFHIDSMQFSN